MPRSLATPMITDITSNSFSPCFLLDLTLKTGIEYVWTGYGSIGWNGDTYKGVGSFAMVGVVKEGVAVKAAGTQVGLSGIDPELLAEALADIQLGAPATLWFAGFHAGAIGWAYPLFVGAVDRPAIPVGPESVTIVLNLENRMINLQRATMRRYTTADQRYFYPDDIGFSWVEQLADISLKWG